MVESAEATRNSEGDGNRSRATSEVRVGNASFEKLQERRDDRSFALVNVLPREAFRETRIPDSINLSVAPSLGSSLATLRSLANEICGECAPRAYASNLTMWMDRIQEQGRRLLPNRP